MTNMGQPLKPRDDDYRRPIGQVGARLFGPNYHVAGVLNVTVARQDGVRGPHLYPGHAVPGTRVAAGRAWFLCGLVAVAFEDLNCVPVDVDDIDGWLTGPEVR